MPQIEEGVFLPIEWHCPEGLISRYATNLVVQHAEHEFYISFFEIMPPLVLGAPEERKAKLEEIESVRAECVARVIVPAGQMPVFIKTLQSNWEAYRSKQTSEGVG
jgi:hypothetical protein